MYHGITPSPRSIEVNSDRTTTHPIPFMKKLLFAILTTFVAIALHAQDTTYYDVNDKLVASLALADHYKVVSIISENPKWTHELTYYKSGKIRSEATLSYWSKTSKTGRYEKTYKEWYESGPLHKEIEFFQGDMYGKALSYWENGNIKHEGTYEKEKCIEGKNFDKNGVRLQDGPYRTPAKYIGGGEAYYKFLLENVIKPIHTKMPSFSANFDLIFKIQKDGTPVYITITKFDDPVICKIAEDAINRMPKWEPAHLDGELSNNTETIPIEIRAENDMRVCNVIDRIPMFPGGFEKYCDFITEHIQYPKQTTKPGISGIVSISCLVDKQGKLSGLKVVKSLNKYCDEEALRVIRLISSFTPATFGGEPVVASITLPVQFISNK